MKLKVSDTLAWKAYLESAKSKHPLLAILWEDAETASGWDTTDNVHAVAPVVLTVGFLIKEGRNAIVVASTVDSEESNNARMLIPKKMIKSVEIIYESEDGLT